MGIPWQVPFVLIITGVVFILTLKAIKSLKVLRGGGVVLSANISLLLKIGFFGYAIYNFIYILISLFFLEGYYPASGTKTTFELFTDCFGYPIPGLSFLRLPLWLVVLLRVVYALLFGGLAFIAHFKFLSKTLPQKSIYLHIISMVLVVFTAYNLYDLILGNLFAFFGLALCVLMSTTIFVHSWQHRFDSEDKANLQKILQYCISNGYKASHKKPQSIIMGVILNCHIKGNGVNNKQVYYAVGKSWDTGFVRSLSRIAGYSQRVAYVGKVAIFLRTSSDEAQKLFDELRTLLGASELLKVNAGKNIERPKTLIETIRNPKSMFKNFRSKNPNNLIARIVTISGLAMLITGITFFMLGVSSTYIDTGVGWGVVLIWPGLIASSIGCYIFEESEKLKLYDKILRITAIVLVVVTLVIILIFILMIIVGMSIFMGMNLNSPQKRRSTSQEPEASSAKSIGRGDMVLEGMHYYIDKSDGSRISIETYDSATGIAKGYDGNTYTVSGGGTTYR